MTTYDHILALAKEHNIQAQPVPLEGLAFAITRLADDEPFVDDIDRLLILMAQANKIDSKTFMSLLYAWQVEKREYREVQS